MDPSWVQDQIELHGKTLSSSLLPSLFLYIFTYMENSAKIVLPLVLHGSWNLRFPFSRRRFHDTQGSLQAYYLVSISSLYQKFSAEIPSLQKQSFLPVRSGVRRSFGRYMLYERRIKNKVTHKNKLKKIKLKPISVDMLVADTGWTGHFSPEHIPFSLTPDLTMEPRLALNSQSSCLNFPREEITGLYCHTRFSLCCFLSSLFLCWDSI